MGSGDDNEFNAFKIIAVLLFWALSHILGSGSKQRVPRPQNRPTSRPKDSSSTSREAQHILDRWKEEPFKNQEGSDSKRGTYSTTDSYSHKNKQVVLEKTDSSKNDQREALAIVNEEVKEVEVHEGLYSTTSSYSMAINKPPEVQSKIQNNTSVQPARFFSKKKEFFIAYEIMQPPVSLRKPRI